MAVNLSAPEEPALAVGPQVVPPAPATKNGSTTETSSNVVAHNEDANNDHSTHLHALQHWNQPRANQWRVFAAFFSFFVMGMSDAAIGALLPYLTRYYDLDYSVISVTFLCPFGGYVIATFINNSIHSKFGQRGVALIGPTFPLIAYIILANHPPFPVVALCFFAAGFGNGLMDPAWCSWIGNMADAHTILGMLQACYSIGGTCSPFIATSLITKANVPWYTFYFVMIGCAGLELVALTWSFWDKTGAVYRSETSGHLDGEEKKGSIVEALKNKVTWVCCIYFFAYMGAEASIAGWIVTFMLNVRHASPYISGISSTCFWAGMTIGRAGLGFVTERFGERLSISVYLVAAIILEIVLWLVPNVILSTIAICLVGIFLGPTFPAGVVMSTKLLPNHLHVSAIGFSSAMGGIGASGFPFMIGEIAQATGVRLLAPVLIGLIAVVLALWLLFPSVKQKRTGPIALPED